MAKTKRVERKKKSAPPQKKDSRAQAESKESGLFFEPSYSKSTSPPSRPLNEETPPSRPLNEEDPQSRALEEDTARLSASSEEAVLDTSFSAQGKEWASTSTHSSSSRNEEGQQIMNVTVMSEGKEITTAMTVLGRVPNPPIVQQKTEDSAQPVHEDNKQEGGVEVNYEVSSDEGGQPNLEDKEPALRDPQSCKHLALRVEPTTTLIQEPSSHHERRSEDNTSDSDSNVASDLIMKESPNAAEIAKPVLNGKSIMEIAERKEISIKTPVHNHNPQRQGLDDNLFDFGDALLDNTSDGGTIRINQGLATFMLIAATAEASNRRLMERKR
jgi:hypothetical protein